MSQSSLVTQAGIASFARDLGTGAVLPTVATDGSALRRGDVFSHTAMGFVYWNGTTWRQEGQLTLTAAQRLALSTAALWPGFQVMETDTLLSWTYDGTQWFPNNPGRINGKTWITANVGLTISTYQVLTMGASRLNGGVTFDATNNGLKVPYDGIYRVSHHNYIFGGAAGSEVMFLATRIRASVGNVDLASAMVTLQSHDQQRSTSDPLVPLKAADIIQLRAYCYATSTSAGSNSEGNGCALTVEYVCPLYGATPI